MSLAAQPSIEALASSGRKPFCARRPNAFCRGLGACAFSGIEREAFRPTVYTGGLTPTAHLSDWGSV